MVDYGPQLVEYACEQCKIAPLFPDGTVTIWNTAECNAALNKRTTADSMLPLPSATVPILVDV